MLKRQKIWLFQQNTGQVSPFIDFNGDVIQNVTGYKFLGCLFKSNGNLRHNLEELAKKARKVLFSLREKTSSLGILPISVSINLFDKLVRHSLTYNSEISFMDYFLVYHREKKRAILRNGNMDHFTFIDITPFEKVHLIFCKNLLGTKKTSSNIGVKAELGRFPVENFINSQAILCLARLHADNLNPLLKETFEPSKSLDSQGVYSWYTYVKKTLNQPAFK